MKYKSTKTIRSKRNILTFALLDLLTGASLTTTEIVCFMISGRLTYTARGRQKFRDDMKKIENSLNSFTNQIKNRVQVYELLCRLKKQGLIDKESKSKKSAWQTTKAGLDKLNLLKSLRRFSEETEDDGGGFILVIFDIPEKNRRARDWLRNALKALGYKYVQKSVFVGQRKIPGEIIEQMKKLNLLPRCVKIFSINKEGSLWD